MVHKLQIAVLFVCVFNCYVHSNVVSKQLKKNILNEETFRSKRSIRGPPDSLKNTVNSLLRGLELSQLKRSVDQQLPNIDISMFTKPADRDDDDNGDADKKIPEWLASINAKIPNGAQVKKDFIPKRETNRTKILANFLQSEVEKEIAKKKEHVKKSDIDSKSNKKFIENLFAKVEDKQSNIPKEITKEIPKLKIAKKSTGTTIRIDSESKSLLDKLFADADAKKNIPSLKKKKKIRKSKQAKTNIEEITKLNAESKVFLQKISEAEHKREIPKDVLIHEKKAFDGKLFPKFLKRAIAEHKDVDRRIAKEMANNKVYATFGATEKKTVERFMDALKKISAVETKLKVKKELNNMKSKKSTNALYAIDENEKCVDEEKDCQQYKEYCNVYETAMKRHCKKTCGFCTTGCGTDKNETLCHVIKQLGYCDRPTAQLKCPETCQCEQCKNSIYGCCWDKKTIKDDYAGSNCPVCENKYDHSICRMFIQDCHSNSIGTKRWMYTNCMETCGLCANNNIQPGHPNSVGPSHTKTCSDNEEQSEFCPIWRNAGWCEEKIELMESYCEKTCYNCQSHYNNNV